MKELLEVGKVVPLIDRSYPLQEAAEAFRYVEEVHAQGKVVITVDQHDATGQNPHESDPGDIAQPSIFVRE